MVKSSRKNRKRVQKYHTISGGITEIEPEPKEEAEPKQIIKVQGYSLKDLEKYIQNYLNGGAPSSKKEKRLFKLLSRFFTDKEGKLQAEARSKTLTGYLDSSIIQNERSHIIKVKIRKNNQDKHFLIKYRRFTRTDILFQILKPRGSSRVWLRENMEYLFKELGLNDRSSTGRVLQKYLGSWKKYIVDPEVTHIAFSSDRRLKAEIKKNNDMYFIQEALFNGIEWLNQQTQKTKSRKKAIGYYNGYISGFPI